MKLIFVSGLFLLMTTAAFAKAVGECRSPKVLLEDQGGSGNFFKLKLSPEAQRVFLDKKIPFDSNGQDIFNLAYQNSCVLWTNLLRIRTEFTLDVCGSRWMLKSHSWGTFHLGKRERELELRDCRLY
jgi:hypothetical protein